MRGPETGVLIQSGGETWRELRNGPITLYGGIALCVVVVAIALFYLKRGMIRLSGPPTGRHILRFNSLERVAHWSMAVSFVILAVTGLILLFGKYVLLPVFGYTLFSWLALIGKNLHNFIGPLFLSLHRGVLLHFREGQHVEEGGCGLDRQGRRIAQRRACAFLALQLRREVHVLVRRRLPRAVRQRHRAHHGFPQLRPGARHHADGQHHP
ncbi:MAG: cytochrome b/b6 domain-containing protein [Rhodocyclaceae bacterium]|nr:cytochrome b/b6 domain-containing protein [Rhodocyclaceae bacterium]